MEQITVNHLLWAMYVGFLFGIFITLLIQFCIGDYKWKDLTDPIVEFFKFNKWLNNKLRIREEKEAYQRPKSHIPPHIHVNCRCSLKKPFHHKIIPPVDL